MSDKLILKVLTVANRKGGAGKSTCAANLAIEATNRGLKTILIDLDPQHTLENWWNKRKEEAPQLADANASNLKEKLEQLRQKGFDLCIIDTPGDTSSNAQIGVEVADLVVIPTKATAPDLSAIGRTLGMVKETFKKPFVFVVTQTISRSSIALKAVSILSGFGPVATTTIANRVSYANAMGEGISAGDAGDKTAAKEIEEVWNFIAPRIIENKLGVHNVIKEKV